MLKIFDGVFLIFWDFFFGYIFVSDGSCSLFLFWLVGAKYLLLCCVFFVSFYFVAL